MKTVRLQVVLRYVEPAVDRVIDVPASATLPELHELLQAAIGWTDSHLHQFVTPQATYGMVIPGVETWPEDERDETGARLADLGTEFEYLYDFGDGWTHHVEVLGPGGPAPGCVDGHGACPPEDCGGPGGYTELLDVLADPAHPEHEHMRSWVGNRLQPFDRAATDQRVRRVVGEVPESVRLLLDMLAGGVKLTPGGRLPRTVVRSMQEHRPHWYPLGRPASIEDDLPPLGALHDVLREVGLLRLRHGVLTPTRAAGDDLDVVRRLRSWFEPNSFDTTITELTIGVLAAHGPLPLEELAPQVYQHLGYGWQRGGQPIDVQAVRTAIAQEGRIMRGLDLIDGTNWREWATGPSALSLLPRAAMLAEVWTAGGG
ncbi:plasmid pRiA4b ORF-3 family protein [Mycobacterium sp. Y57]|uniref:plasmid pRiA4b ORF-3 family protein n=1 Tax=Mycolicibacterium xanthum TaxID=2796469 RepID=UPI001C845455|nr:plasmid pRiA4b ORF-3 family protein [Mycolicibacterium xanthum]MBX7432560.1 plasmid pRiA4b ORF-3 family protein [Mycolicibacterium xanthum]